MLSLRPLFGGYSTGPWGWNALEMPIEEFRDRVSRSKKEMGRRGIDALLVFGRADGSWKNGNVLYLANANVCYNRSIGLIIPREGDPTLLGCWIPRDFGWEVRASTWIGTSDLGIPSDGYI